MSDQLYQLYPSDLTNRQWQNIKEHTPAAKPGGRPRTLDMRLVLNAIFYVLVGGIQWRMLPREYPQWQSVYHYFRLWRQDGTWQRIHDTLRARVRQQVGKHKHPTAGCLDSQSVKCSHIKGTRGFDGGKKVNGRKRHVLVDTLGLVMGVWLPGWTSRTPPERGGCYMAWAVPAKSCAASGSGTPWVRTYRGQLLDWVQQRFKFCLQPVLRNDDQKGFVLLPKRWIMERTFGWLNVCRRLSKEYEELPNTSETFIQLAMIRIMARRAK